MMPLDTWQLLGGIGLFLFAMAQIESGLKALAGHSFARMLRSNADRPFRSLLGGIGATAVLQSSSIVGLMVLAITGAGLMPLRHALAVIFGSNLGTTFTGWLVAALGFKLELESLALPLLAFGALAFVTGRKQLSESGRIVTGLALLLLGLGFMKDSAAGLGDTIDIAMLAGFSAWQFLLFGVVVAAVIQSSSATMLITLAALDAGLITLPSAAAVAIGADLGTTTTVLLGAVTGASARKQVAAGHFLFNVTTDLLAFVLRIPLLMLVTSLVTVDPVVGLVAFHSLFNILGILLFMPMIGPFARFLEWLFPARPDRVGRYVSQVTEATGSDSIAAIESETAHLLARVVRQQAQAFSPPLPIPAGVAPASSPGLTEPVNGDHQFDRLYADTKQLEGELLDFTARIQAGPLDEAAARRLAALVSAVRQGVHAAKSIKDVRHNLEAFTASPSTVVNGYVECFRDLMNGYYRALFRVRPTPDDRIGFEGLAVVLADVHRDHDQLHERIYADIRDRKLTTGDISSLLNVNREVLNANVSLLMALADYYLDPAEADALARLPGSG